MADKLQAHKEHYEVRARGIPCLVSGQVLPAEPDVGIFCAGFEPDALYDRKGYRAKWLEDRMTDSDWDSVAEQVNDQIGDGY